VLVVLGVRPGRADLEAFQLHPLVRVSRPGPLSDDAIARSLGRTIGDDGEESFVRACAHATGGNPFLVQELLREIRAEGIIPDAAQV
jgi:hypothetical protein